MKTRKRVTREAWVKQLRRQAVDGQVLCVEVGCLVIAVLVEHITPQRARAYLALNANNRKIRKTRLREMLADVAAQLWLFNHHAIAFDETGALLDGQHRLRTVVDSNVAMYCIVVYGIPRDHIAGIDCIATRTTKDHGDVLQRKIPARMGACARMMMRTSAMDTGYISNSRVLGYILRHEEVMRRALDALSPKAHHICTAAVDAAFAKAAHGIENGRLMRAGQLLCTGEPPNDKFEPGDKTMLRLRNHLLELYARRGKGGANVQANSLQHTAYALETFCAGRDVESLRVPHDFNGFWHTESVSKEG
jgi:hypothetical protein